MIKIDYSKEEINRFELLDIIFSNNIQFYNYHIARKIY